MRRASKEPRTIREFQPLERASPKGRLVLVLLAISVAGVAISAAQDETLPALAGVWRLHQTTGDLPEQAARALDGKLDAKDAGLSATIRIDQTATALTVRRMGNPGALLRVMPFTRAFEHQVPDGGVLKGRAVRRDGAVVVNGQVGVKQGFLKRNVPFEEVWQLDDSAKTLRVTATLNTPLGVKRRIQVFTRVTEDGPRAGQTNSSSMARQAPR